MRSREEAPPPQAAGGHVKVTAVFLHQNVRGQLGSAEKRMLGLVNRERLRDAVLVSRVRIVPAGGQFLERNAVGRVAIDLVRGHVDERRFQAMPPRRLEQVQCPHRVGVEIVKRNGRRAGSCAGCAAVWTIRVGLTSLTTASMPARSRMSASWCAKRPGDC